MPEKDIPEPSRSTPTSFTSTLDDEVMDRPKQAQLNSIQAMRGVAAILVVVSHIILSLRPQIRHADIKPPEWLQHGFNVGACGVDLFFIISGFIIVYVTSRSKSGLLGCRDFVIKRLIRIYPTYWFFLLFSIGGLVIRAQLSSEMYAGDRFPIAIPWIIRSIFLFPAYKPGGSQDFGPLLGPGWTLSFELFFYAVFAVCLCTIRSTKLRAQSVAAISVTLGCLGTIFADQLIEIPVLRMVTHPLLFEFAFGCLLATQCERLAKLRFSVSVSLVSVGLGLLVFDHIYQLHPGKLGLTRPIIYGVPCGLLFTGIVSAELRGMLNVHRWLIAIGDASYATYLSHSAITLKVLGIAWLTTGFYHQTPLLVVLLLNLAACLVVGQLFYYLVEIRMINGLRAWCLPMRASPSNVSSPSSPNESAPASAHNG
ncbi:Acyltransferase family protein [Rosistilla oblonga]|uniref:acyltransferase family protein n=1 Tax=Rosistilla oblonga TaxID=2527990 RepID=UPI00118B02C7|nr:acyltransferase [Rosistilla oblonga]QDV12553.1 Acyltransferase family protein [Rosistilla oblonga]